MNDILDDVDVDFEPEDEHGSVGALKQKIVKLKEELESVRLQRQEYLDGWQRCKADSINARQEMLQSMASASKRAQDSIIEEIIPVIDSFDMAMQANAWKLVEGTWRQGVESIAKQLTSALEAAGAMHYGAIGEPFDPVHHEILEEVNQEGVPHTIARVIRRGWKRDGRVLRPAQVALIRENLDAT